MSYVRINRPLKPFEVGKLLSDDNVLRVDVEIDLSELIDNDIEGLNDLAEELILEDGILSDINYHVVGYTDDNGVIIRVSAEVS